MTSHREDLDYGRVFASSKLVVGRMLRDIRFPEGVACTIAHVRRGDADLMPNQDLILEFGDRVGLLANRAHMKPTARVLRRFDQGNSRVELHLDRRRRGARAPGRRDSIADSRRRQARARARGAAAGRAVSRRVRRVGPFVWTMPLSANLVLRNFGLTSFSRKWASPRGRSSLRPSAWRVCRSCCTAWRLRSRSSSSRRSSACGSSGCRST